MRLDLFLKASRLVVRRSVARQLCDANRVKVNGVAAKASKEIKVGDEIMIVRGEKRMSAKVLEIPNSKQVSKQIAGSMVDIVGNETVDDPLLS
jgi:ribosomal 50S subunit-recycling heat shock protein